MNAPNAALPTIVVVDDEPVALEFCRYVLIRAGYNVYAASSGEEALVYVRSNRSPVDLALVDVGMRGMSGVEFVKRLENLKLDTKIVLMSGYSPDEVQKILGKETAPYRSIWKPFGAATLIQMVKNVLATQAEARS
jgi:DNA-binding response OmpR family regulator